MNYAWLSSWGPVHELLDPVVPSGLVFHSSTTSAMPPYFLPISSTFILDVILCISLHFTSLHVPCISFFITLCTHLAYFKLLNPRCHFTPSTVVTYLSTLLQSTFYPPNFSNNIVAVQNVSNVPHVRTTTLELLCDTGANCFVVNSPDCLHNLVQCNEFFWVTGGSRASVKWKGTLIFILKSDKSQVLVKVTNVPCIPSNPHSGFPLTPFKDFGFIKAIHITRDKVILKSPQGTLFYILATSQRNRLDYITLDTLHPCSPIPCSFTMVHLNNTLEAHEKFFSCMS